MNSDADTLRGFLLGLLDAFSPTSAAPSGGVGSGDPAQGLQPEQLGPSLDSRPGSDGVPADGTATHTAVDMPPLSTLGELPAVQTHFQSLLKRRLQSEIERRPPLFPWESELQEYPLGAPTVSLASPWLAQLRSLKLPTALPEAVLTRLLTRCQTLAQAALQPGVQLVQAVEELFPEQPETMNQIAGLVLAAGPARDGNSSRLQALENAFPAGYEGANPQQQVTLAMLAANEIFDALTLSVSATAPTTERCWGNGPRSPGSGGELWCRMACKISAQLPGPGSLCLVGQGEPVAQPQAGAVTLSLANPDLGQFYPLAVSLGTDEPTTLTFTLVARPA
jgi:hypothetical protein